MSNHYFQFKEFTVEQNKCGMKVCTDACILGAYANAKNTRNILDIGAGTGLLSLMLAQRFEAIINAVEIDKNAYLQARENIKNSPWKKQIAVHHSSIQNYTADTKEQFGFIISNPPFYQNHLQENTPSKNTAHHTVSLSQTDLLSCVDKLLTDDGKFVVLLPIVQSEQLEQQAKNHQLFTSEKLLIRDREASKNIKIIATYQRKKTNPITNELIIKKADGSYSTDFVALLKDYYLYL